MIEDGKHLARLFDITFFTTDAGTPAVSFVWDLVESGERVTFSATVTDPSGRPNYFAIQTLRRWVPEWDARSVDWFRDNRERLLGSAAYIHTRDGGFTWISPAPDADVAASRVENAASASDLPRQAAATPNSRTIELVVDEQTLATMPDDIEPTAEAALAFFRAITEGTDKLDADLLWTHLAQQIGPLQIDFHEAEWKEMISKIRQLKSGKHQTP